MPNTSSVVCVTPVKTGGVLTASPNGTANLISVVCNKPVRPSVNVPTPIVPVTAAASSALVIAASVPANNTDTVGVSAYKAPSETRTEVSPRVMPPMVSPASHLAAVKPVAPSASTYTLVMLPGSGGSQSQIVVLPTNILRPKDIAPTVSTAQGQQSLPPSASQESQPSQTTRAVPPAATFLVQSERADPAKELQDKLDTIRLSELKDMREAILAVAAHFPLVGVTEAEKSSCFPYGATDGATYFSWPLPKQRASEWMRAGDVRQTLQRLIDHERPTWFLSSLGVEDCQRLLPSRRSIVLLCRHFGFTPLHPDTNDELQDTGMGSAHTIIHNSYSEPCELVARLADAVCAVEGAQECTRVAEEEVDVEGVEEADGGLQEGANMPNSRTRASVRASAGAFPGCLSPEKSFPRQAKVHLPLSPMAAFVREAASEVGVHLTSCELEPRVDVPVVEEMIVSACKNFATALLRNAVNMAFRRVDYESTPSSVSLEDTYRGILDLRECSFLTNENLGIEATREGTCDDAHV
uniref:Putative yeats domain-containing protein 2 n=1 Tax=Amblyomma triste TaxID=251400 RepID=A0A023GG18_AMBTT